MFDFSSRIRRFRVNPGSKSGTTGAGSTSMNETLNESMMNYSNSDHLYREMFDNIENMNSQSSTSSKYPTTATINNLNNINNNSNNNNHNTSGNGNYHKTSQTTLY